MTDQSNMPQPPEGPPPAPPAGGRGEKLTSTRCTARQGTSPAAWRGEAPGEDDPLLGFAPVPHVAPRRNSITADRQRAFIAHLAATGIVAQAARQIGASLEAIYRLRNKAGGEEFRAAWDIALDRGIARLEDGALARAIEGEERMVVSAGKLMGSERRHNEGLVMFFLKNRRAHRYGADWRTLKPGDPLYEKVRAEIVEAERPDMDEVRASILRKIEAIEAHARREKESRAGEDGGARDAGNDEGNKGEAQGE